MEKIHATEKLQTAAKELNKKGLSRDAVKYIAMLTMLLNHIANIFLDRGTLLGELFLDVGYFTAPCMCYFLVEGYYYTRSKVKYMGRLFLFAVLSQYPFYLALFRDRAFPGVLNMMFTLCFCFLILEVKNSVHKEWLRWAAYIVLILATEYCDWADTAAIYTLLFAYSYGSEKKMKRAFAFAAVLFALPMFMTNSMQFPLFTAVLLSAGATAGVAAAGIVILYFYNGKKGTHAGGFSKWFFYCFYPGHLLILGILRMILQI